jgi:hypothetical protein
MLKAISRVLLFIPILLPLPINGQLQHGSANYSDATNYGTGSGHDSLFIFYTENNNKYIEAFSPSGDTVDFEWSAYNPATTSYVPFSTIHNTYSRLDISEAQGYRLVILGLGSNDTSRCWTMIDDFSIVIYNNDSILQGDTWIKTIPTPNKWCHLVRDIWARIDSAHLSYYNPQTGVPVYIHTDYFLSRNNWKAKPVAEEPGINHFVRNDDYWLNIDVQDPNWEDTWYILKATDPYGLQRSDSVFYKTIEPHADFSYRYIHLNNSAYYPGHSDNYYKIFYSDSIYNSYISAPALYYFKNLSINADTMIWYFGDKENMESGGDSILHTYQLPGSYKPVLIVYTYPAHLYDACTDTFPKADEALSDTNAYPIVIDEASIQGKSGSTGTNILPNILTCPSGRNNIFRFVDDVSITDFEIVIYNRYGKRVYHFKGNIRDWDGWDGHDKNSNRYVESGVYYYTVKDMNVLPDFETGKEVRLAKTYPSKDATGKAISSIYRGFIHVYNNE